MLNREVYADEIADDCGSYCAFSLNGSRVGPENRVSSRPVVKSSLSCSDFSNSGPVIRRLAFNR